MSRLWRYGSCYSRIRDFIQNRFIADDGRPIWFDVWTCHPPFRDPILGEKEDLNEFRFRPRQIDPPQGDQI